jgi:hypothetical protein
MLSLSMLRKAKRKTSMCRELLVLVLEEPKVIIEDPDLEVAE